LWFLFQSCRLAKSRFTDKTLNHITYIDKELWDSPDDALKQKILNDAKKNKAKIKQIKANKIKRSVVDRIIDILFPQEMTLTLIVLNLLWYYEPI
jgi:hypothetical protein